MRTRLATGACWALSVFFLFHFTADEAGAGTATDPRWDEAHGCSGLNLLGENARLAPCSRLGDNAELPQRLVGVDLRGSRLDHVVLRRRQLDGARFDRVSGREASLAGASGEGASFARADLRGIDGTDSRWLRSSFAGADARSAKLLRADFRDSSFVNARLRHAFLAHATFRGCDLRGADLEGAVVANTDFDGALFDASTRLPFPESEALRHGMLKR